ncbi:SpoIIE family protein phosphatase [Desulfotomaculum sp. 1211_IL3151]|uniref:SpoIIE family protein phosphatase n=1 Tax=Desulfotomaculum sp. 1211_IL3151 TaxID=3084055 RepID=UPI002FDA65ED
MEINKNMFKPDTEVKKVTLFASFIIILSILLVGSISYIITEKEVVNKLKSKDLATIADAISSKIDGRIQRAQETSLILAQDPEMMHWVVNGERDIVQQNNVLQRISQLTSGMDYSNSFVVSNLTGHYWTETGQIIDTMSPTDPDDQWFYRTLAAKQRVSIDIDYNQERKDTFVFINAIMGDVNKPLAITGVGLSLKEFSRHFEAFKYGENSHLWLIDKEGNIYLSNDLSHNGRHVIDFLPKEVTKAFLATMDQEISSNQEYKNNQGQLVDLISYPLASTDWLLLVEIPRNETVAFLNTIKLNTLLASIIVLVSITFFFIFVSRNLTDPYKKALQLNQQLEEQVAARTQELSEKNQKLMDSIDYAKRIQEAILPSNHKLNTFFKDYFLLWKPKDLVGGDFYWSKRFDKELLIAVGDCTGHGVPGALMTMITISVLNQIADEETKADPANILQKLNIFIKETLNQETKEALTDDGLDIGLCYFNGEDTMVFAGAKSSLYIKANENIQIIKGDKKSIGYVRTEKDYYYTNHTLEIKPGTLFYLTTDGFLDQNGGSNANSFGKKRFIEIINGSYQKDLSEQGKVFLNELLNYMGDESQRDDITVMAFTFDLFGREEESCRYIEKS